MDTRRDAATEEEALTLAQDPEEVEHPGPARIFTEGDQPVVLVARDELEVIEGDPLFQNLKRGPNLMQ